MSPSYSDRQLLAFVLLHAPLTMAFRALPGLSTAHALVTILFGLLVLGRDRTPTRIVWVVCYLTGAELVWRGTGALIFWETGKYAATAFSFLAALRWGSQLASTERTGLVYAALGIPSLFVLPYFNRSEIAFNLAGPICLGICAWAFSGIRVHPEHMRTALVALMAPVVGLAFISAVSTAQVQDFGEVMIGGKATTAGIGPNQVSAVLGLGALASATLVTMFRRTTTRLAFAALAVWFLAQAMLSLSRGGFWVALATIGLGYALLLRDRRQRQIVLVALIILVPAFQLVVFPAIDRYTGGLVKARFTDDRLTGRDKIVAADIQIFRDNLLLGVGPGQSKYGHELTFRVSSAHTEYSRLLAEHGLLGAVALVLLVAMGISRHRRARHPLQRAVALSFGLWAALTMGHSAMRMVAPATMLALAGVRWVLPGDPEPTRRRALRRASLAVGLSPRQPQPS